MARGKWIADSRKALLLSWHGPGTFPTYCLPENPRIAGLIAFFNERVDLVVDGERLKRPFIFARRPSLSRAGRRAYGGGGIRTHGPAFTGQRFSRAPHSTSLPPLHAAGRVAGPAPVAR
jgi:hypothetical protein